MRWTISVCCLAIPALASAQETYTLKLPNPAKGDAHRVIIDMRQTARITRLDTFGNDLKDRSSTSTSQLNYVDQHLEVEKGEVTRFRRRFDAAAETGDDGKLSVLPIQGKTVVVDQRGKSRQLTWESGEQLSDAVTRQLQDALAQGKEKLGGMASFEPLPDRPVKVGESWSIDVSAIVKDCEEKHGCKLTGATGVGTLKQVYQGTKGPCARVEVHIQVPLREIKNGDKVVNLKEGSGTLLAAAYDFALGGTDSYFASSMRLNFLAAGTNPESDGTATRMRVDLAVDVKEHRGSGK